MQAGGKARQLRSGRGPPASAEPSRGKVQWDHLLDEMKWMQNEFSSERKIKIKQLKQTATKAVKSKRDLISRSEVRCQVFHFFCVTWPSLVYLYIVASTFLSM